MSTTVTYKGSTLTTVNNQTRTLKTAGKYMEGDVVLTDVSSSGGYVTQDQNGYIILPPNGDGSPSIGGLEYEEGTWAPNVDTNDPIILFSGNHTNAPFFVMMTDITGTYDDTTGISHAFVFCDWEKAFGEALIANSTSYIYALKRGVYRSGTTAFSNAGLLVNSREDVEAYVDNTKFVPRNGNSPTTWKAGRTYKWIAVWAPII